MENVIKCRRIESGYYLTNIVLVGNPDQRIYIERHMDERKKWHIPYIWNGFKKKTDAIKYLYELMNDNKGQYIDDNGELAQLAFKSF